jgi:hypothetical protein
VETSYQTSADAAGNWKPLGLFMLVRDVGDKQPGTDTKLFLQLALSKDGYIGGTYYNDEKNKVQEIAGQVDTRTQRAAFRVGNDRDTVIETGVYSLTQDIAPVLIHYGREKTEPWLLVRLKDQDAGYK